MEHFVFLELCISFGNILSWKIEKFSHIIVGKLITSCSIKKVVVNYLFKEYLGKLSKSFIQHYPH